MRLRPSSTARLIARALVLLAADPSKATLVPPGAAQASLALLAATGGDAEQFQRLVRRPWFRKILFVVERWTLPGILGHYARRKRFLEEVARESLEAGFTQVVVLGAGLDTLALRLCTEYPQALFWEMDKQATQHFKRAGLAAAGQGGPNLCLLPLDLNTACAGETLKTDASYRPEALTLFLAEGLLMYLTPEQVSDVFADLHNFCGPGSRFGFTFMEIGSDGHADFTPASRLIRRWLELRGEPFQWGIGRQALSEFLRIHHWTLRETATPDDLRDRYTHCDAKPHHVRGDLVAVAER